MTAWVMRRTIYERDVLPEFRKRPLPESDPEDLRALCVKVKYRDAAATAMYTAISASRSTGSPFCARYALPGRAKPALGEVGWWDKVLIYWGEIGCGGSQPALFAIRRQKAPNLKNTSGIIVL